MPWLLFGRVAWRDCISCPTSTMLKVGMLQINRRVKWAGKAEGGN